MSSPWRCTTDSATRGESLIGTASTVRAFLVIEAPGSWGVDAVRDNRLPDSVKNVLARRANQTGVRLLMIRRHGRSTPCDITVFAAYADPVHPWLQRGCVSDADGLLDIDLAGLGAGRTAGLEPHSSPLYLVCTHGRHDVCCAERGRPVAAALHGLAPDDTWEVSHIGGDRFAGNVLVLPDGLYYGRLSAANARTMCLRHRDGHLDLDHLRGRCGHPFAIQAAEIFLRKELGFTGLHQLELTGRSSSGRQTESVFTDGTRSWSVRVATETTDQAQLTCRAPAPSRGLRHTLCHITSV